MNPPPNSDAIEIITLGGCGGFGMNATLVIHERRALLIDYGIGFPGADRPGVAALVVDPSPIMQRVEHLEAVVLTHAHDDHIGGVPHLPQAWRHAPFIGAPLTLAAVRDRCRDHSAACALRLEILDPGQRRECGPFSIEMLSVAHSVPQSRALAIDTPAGLIVFTADFKLDPSPPDGIVSDEAGFRRLGKRGVRLLAIDSTGARRPGTTPSESEVRPRLLEQIGRATGQVVASTFSSHLYRLEALIAAALETGRRVAVAGRRMARMLHHARSMDLIDIPAGLIETAEELLERPPHRRLWLAGGSQAEPLSALSRIARGQDPRIRLGEDDLVLISALVIPGNDAAISALVDRLLLTGARVVHSRDHPLLHVSGHASSEEIRTMMRWLRPKAVLPLHGEVSHLVAAGRLAREEGIAGEQIVIPGRGDVLRLDSERFECVDHTEMHAGCLDDAGRPIAWERVLERRRMAQAGTAWLTLLWLDEAEPGQDSLAGIEWRASGLAFDPGEEAILGMAREMVGSLTHTASGVDTDTLRARLATRVANRIRRGNLRRPLIIVDQRRLGDPTC